MLNCKKSLKLSAIFLCLINHQPLISRRDHLSHIHVYSKATHPYENVFYPK
jgi:hypothetical protein